MNTTLAEQSIVGQQTQQQNTFNQPNSAVYGQQPQQARGFEHLRGPSGEVILDPDEPGLKVEERIERQKRFYQAKLSEKEAEKEDALIKRLEADANAIKLQDEKRALEQKNRIMENQYTASFRRGVNTEVQQLNTPEGAVREAVVNCIEKNADYSRKVAPLRNTYMLI